MSDISRVTQQSATILMVADLESSCTADPSCRKRPPPASQSTSPRTTPPAPAEVLTLNTQLGRFQQYSSNISDGQSWLNTADSTLGSVVKAPRPGADRRAYRGQRLRPGPDERPGAVPGGPEHKAGDPRPGGDDVQQPAHLFGHLRHSSLSPGFGRGVIDGSRTPRRHHDGNCRHERHAHIHPRWVPPPRSRSPPGTYTPAQLATAVQTASGGNLDATLSAGGELVLTATSRSAGSALQVTGGDAASRSAFRHPDLQGQRCRGGSSELFL